MPASREHWPTLFSIKWFERLGRWLLVWIFSFLLQRKQKPIVLGKQPKILVVRLDERVGNALLLLPMMLSLRNSFPNAHIHLLGSNKIEKLMADQRALDAFLPFEKRALFSAKGPLLTPFRLAQNQYDLAIDAANPTDPSFTQAVLVRLSGATHTVGTDLPEFVRLYSAPVKMGDSLLHEIDLRLTLLQPLPNVHTSRWLVLDPKPHADATSGVWQWLQGLAKGPLIIVNVGARTKEKLLLADQYAALCRQVSRHDGSVALTFGPRESELAHAIKNMHPDVLLAPPTNLLELATLMKHAHAVISCDTGPMHLAVALEIPTCSIFVATDPGRFGHHHDPHLVVDARTEPLEAQFDKISNWIDRHCV